MKGLRLLLTGASGALGRALAMRFAERGVRLVLTGRTQGALAEVSDAIVERGFEPPVLVVLDMREAQQVEALGNAVFERLGGLEALVLNAALLGELSPVAHGDRALWDEVFAVNVLAARSLLAGLHPLLTASRGIVVGVTCGEKRGEAFWGCYGASKAAFEVMLRSYGEECSRLGVEVCCWDPGRMSSSLRAAAYPGERGERGERYPITERTTQGCVELVERWSGRKR